MPRSGLLRLLLQRRLVQSAPLALSHHLAQLVLCCPCFQRAQLPRWILVCQKLRKVLLHQLTLGLLLILPVLLRRSRQFQLHQLRLAAR